MKKQCKPEPLSERVLEFIREHKLVTSQRSLLVAVSGGPDSVCLLHILAQLQDKLKIKLHIAHLDHQLRGAESEADARYVADLARQLDIPFTLGKHDVKAYRTRQRISLEEAAREVRYNFLAEVSESIGAEQVAVGHTSDDHVETILMHLIRGTGTRGLRGLQSGSRWPYGSSLMVIRPLLQVSRAETAAYCRDHKLEPRMDSTNQSLSPLRNRIRHQLLPLLRSYNQGIADALLRTARIAGDDIAFLDKEATRLWNKVVQKQGDTVILDRTKLLKLPTAVKRQLLRTAIEQLAGKLKDIETRHIDEIMALLPKPAGKRLNLPYGLVFTNEYNEYRLSLETATPLPSPTIENEIVLKVPGETVLPGWRVTAAIFKRKPIAEPKLTGKASTDNLKAFFDLDNIGNKLVVRLRRTGDRFQPLGMSQPKKLNEFMIDAKIPRARRRRIPIVCSPEHILWVVGWRIDERARVTENSRNVLSLNFESTDER